MSKVHCDHPKLYFGSGDYYIFCQACGAGWMRKAPDRPEYNDGCTVGGAPDLAQGFVSGDPMRVVPETSKP